MYVYYISEVTAYLKKTWLTPYKEKFVSVWVDKFLHYGNYTTNRVESQHAKLKVYLDSAQSDLPTALPRIDEAVHSQFYAITSSMGQSMVIARHRFSDHDFFKNLVGLIYKDHIQCHLLIPRFTVITTRNILLHGKHCMVLD